MSVSGDRPTDARQRLLEHFSVPEEQHGKRWSELWDRGEFLPWDRGPNPALDDVLSQRGQELGLTSTGRKKKALVPGCGRGYDVVLFQSYGIDAVGVEISASAVREARSWAAGQQQRKAAAESLASAGTLQFVEGDFFEDDWAKECGVDPEGGFDCVFDYTFLCAMPPTVRPAWGQRMAQLLVPGSGILICLEFPTYKPLSTGGPPWGVTSELYNELLGSNFDRIMHFRPARTHPIGQGTDWMSIWRRKA